MSTNRKHFKKTALAIAAMLVVGVGPTQEALGANSCTWNPATGNWGTAGNWSCGAVPGTIDSATIALGKLVTVNSAQGIFTLVNGGGINIDASTFTLAGGGSTTNTGTINVGSAATAALQVLAGHNITNTGGVINVADGSVISQFGSSITGGTINTTGAGALVASNNNSNFLSGVTLNGTLDLAIGTGIERITGGLVLGGGSAAINVNSNSVLSFAGGAQTLGGTGNVVLGNTGASNRALSMEGDTALTIGAGIVVRGQNGTIGLAYLAGGNQTLINNGRITADVAGGTIHLAPSGGTTNNGVLEAKNGGTLMLDSSVTGTVGGHIDVGAGSTVWQNGVALNGVINSAGGGSFRVANSNSNTLSGATFNGILDLASGTGIERADSGLTLNGTVNVNSNSVLSFRGGDQTIGGSGTVVLGNTGASNRALSMEGDMTLTIGSGIVVRGENGTIGGTYLAGGTQKLVNNGRISGDVSGGTLRLAPGAGTTNNGVLEAKNGGTLFLDSNVTGTVGGHIDVGAGSTVWQNGVALNGVINAAGGGSFRVVNSNSNFLSGATFNGILDLATGTGIDRVDAGLTLNGTVNINSNSVLSFRAGDQTLSGAGTIVLGSTGASNRALSMEGDLVLTIGSGIVVRGENGTIGLGYLAGGVQTLVNNGRISADVSGGTLNLSPSNGTVNHGILEAQNGGTLFLNTAVTGAVGSSIVAGAGSTVWQNGVALSGVINSAGTGLFRATNSNANFLNGVNFNGPLDLASGTSVERVTGGLTLNGAINVNTNSVLSFNGSQTFDGAGTIVLGDTGSSNRALSMEGDMTLTVGSGITVRGKNGTVGQAYLAGGTQVLANNGSIVADVAGGQIDLSAALTHNAATLAAANGGTLRLNSTVTNIGSGHIDAGDASNVIQNGITITGGTINTSGSGRFTASNNNSNFLSGLTLRGLLDMASGTSVERILNGMTLASGGSVNVNSNSVLSFNGDQTLGGSGSIVLGNTGSSNRALSMEGAMTLTVGPNVVVHGVNGTLGQAYIVGGTQNLINNGTINSDGGGTIFVGVTGALTNNGTMRAQSGALTIQDGLTGTGTLQADSGGVLNLANFASTQGKLVMGAAGSTLNIGTQNLTITNDYTNVAFGVGNSFIRRAGVAGAGLILAGGDAAQAITGTDVTNGNTANATLTLGNVRVGATTFNYQVANTGSTGPSLRGAIQTNVNGANLNDVRLSGVGVTAGNYNTGAPGSNTGDLGVTFTVASAGAIAPLSGQLLNLRSNFANIADQKLNIVLGSGAAAYNAAVGSTTSPVQVANQRINGNNSAVLAVANTAPAGAFSEDLNASFGGATGAVTGSGTILGRLAGTNNTGSGAISVGVDTATAGAKTGGVTVNYQTAGAVNNVSNGMGTASVGSQLVTVNGNVYQAAAGAIQSAALNFGTVQVGQLVSQSLVIRNTATGPSGFVEDLNASFGSASGVGAALISGTGSLNGILAGTNSTAGNGVMTVAVSTVAAGVVNGDIAVNYFTAGAVNSFSNGLGSAAVGSDHYGVAGTIQAVANVINQASPVINNPVIDFGAMRVGAASPTAHVIVTNQATIPPQAALNASISSNGAPVTASGSFNLLAPGSTSTNQLVVGLNTAVAGSFAGSATIAFVSDANNVGNCAPNCQLDLPSQQVSVSGKVYTPAVAQVNTTTVDFGIVHRGDVVSTREVSVTNSAAVTGLNDTLSGSIGGAPAPFSAAGSFAGLAAQGTDAASLHVGLNTTTAGVFSGTATAAFASHDADLADLDLGSSAIALKGQVNNYADAAFTKSGAGQLSVSNHTYTLDFGTILLGSGDLSASLAVLNGAIGPADLLSGDFDLIGVGPGFTLSGFGSFADLIAGDSFGGLSVVFASQAQGAFLSSLVLHSTGSNASGFIGQLDDTTLVLRGNVSVVAVPEPGTYVLMFAGLLVVVGAARSRRRQPGQATA